HTRFSRDWSSDVCSSDLDEWVEGHRVGESTKSGYRRLIRPHVKPYIGEVELAKLTSTRLAALYRKLESEGRRNHKGELTGEGLEIGRASCRERGEVWGEG